MKKKLFGTMVVVAAMFAGYSAYDAQNESELANKLLSNVEALAENEGNGMTDCINGCLTTGGHCFCYGYQPYEEKKW